MVRALYSLLLWLLQPLLLRKLRRRALAEPGYAHAVQERMGRYGSAALPADPSRPLVWVHAVSLGETRAAAVLVAQLRQQLPGMRLLLTHGTATGWAQGTPLLREGDLQTWLPWDTPGAVRRFLQHFAPRLGVLLETEVWPNLVAQCRAQQVPLCLVNARLSEKSLRQAQRLAWLARSAFAGLHGVWAQTEDDAQRLRSLGAVVRGVVGNFKFDASPDAAQVQQGQRWRALQPRPVLMFASSREGEERMLLDALMQEPVKTRCAGLQWLIVPRHPQRFEDVALLMAEGGRSVSRRSDWQEAPAAADVWVGNSLGEMALYFGMADVALLGGSFAPLGGQNLIEAAACACPVITGPHTFNFADAADGAVAAGAALRVADMQQALLQAAELLEDPEALAVLRERALLWSQAHRGAAARTAQALLQSVQLV